MAASASPNNLDTLIDAGSALFAAGDYRGAHDRWREAAIIDPYDERVWLLLLQVLDSDEDRRVCLENIISLNPNNVEARRQLRAVRRRLRLEGETAPVQAAQGVTLPRTEKRAARKVAQSRRPSFVISLLRGIWIGVLALLLGIALSVLVYGVILARLS